MEESSIREITSEQTLLSKPDGSSNYSQGDSTVMVGVYGPADIKQSKEKMDRATVEVIFKPKVGFAGVREKAMEDMISNTCEAIIITTMHPRSSITVIIQVIQDAGSLLSCCINAVCMALMDAGISMKCLVAAVSCAITDEGAIIVDPTLKVTEDAATVLHFAFDNTEEKMWCCQAPTEYVQRISTFPVSRAVKRPARHFFNFIEVPRRDASRRREM